MADDVGERTEQPTPKRRADARKRGQIAKSQDLSAAVVMLTGLLTISATAPFILERLLMLTRALLGDLDPAVRAQELSPLAALAGGVIWDILWPILVAVFLASLIIMLLQVGRLFTLETVRPKLTKLNPINGLKRLFSARTAVMMIINMMKLSAVLLVTSLTVRQHFDQLVFLFALPHLSMLGAAGELVYTLMIRLGVLLLLIALIDYAYQKYKNERELKMTRQEIREEMKRMDGDPLVKRRQRETALKLMLQRMRKTVPEADVVVTNPTHFAVALKYDAERMGAPRVVAKGADFLAKKIREIAVEHGIPIVERPPLARALYKAVEVGQEIPSQFYKAVAEILAYVYELRRKGRRARAGVAT